MSHTARGDPPIITDAGRACALQSDQGTEIYLPRYAVWCYDRQRQAMQVKETHDSLPFLQAKYGVPDERVLYWPIFDAPPAASPGPKGT